MSTRTLLLTAWYFPMRVLSWQDAVKMIYEGTVDVLAEYDEEIRSPSVTWKSPAVVRLRRSRGMRRTQLLWLLTGGLLLMLSLLVQAVVPDVFVRRGPRGDWQIEVNSDILPRVLVNRTYYASVSKKTRDGAEKSFLVDCLNTANWLTKSLDQRAQTILKVATEIVKQQDAFLTHGIAHLRPMTLKTVAAAIEMHESTVSRVTANKYIATPRGLFEMKYFFTTALGSSSGGEDHSAASVRHRIRQLIDAEPVDAILSDDTIAEMLKAEQGIDVARRTVAKYREGMDIPSSVVRRRQKRMQMA
jgi:RNA polymerase sigma-54 factor